MPCKYWTNTGMDCTIIELFLGDTTLAHPNSRGLGSSSRVVDVVGFEPTTSWLQTKHSSN
jgi:hypothetical protein